MSPEDNTTPETSKTTTPLEGEVAAMKAEVAAMSSGPTELDQWVPEWEEMTDIQVRHFLALKVPSYPGLHARLLGAYREGTKPR